MKRIILIFSILAAIDVVALEFSGNTLPVVTITPDSSSGLEAIYVLNSTNGVKVSYTSGGNISSWEQYSSLGGAFSEPVNISNSNTITLNEGDMGYIVTVNGRQHCYWIIDYSTHQLDLGSLTPSADSDCGRQVLHFTGTAAEIPYYSINGRRMTLSRELQLEYDTQVYNEEEFTFNIKRQTETLPFIDNIISVPAHLIATSFTLTGDRFLQTWNDEQSIESTTIQAQAVDAGTRATQELRESDNEQKTGDEGLGGSAPANIYFEAIVSDAVVFHEWQISRSPEFEDNDITFNELEFNYSFQEQGTTYVRFIAANAEGNCDYIGSTYEVFIGESKLEIPNAFSPSSSEGINDEWKVSYKSLISYECHIFNRWGTELFASTDPSQGWDGRHGGKIVSPGVYYYVIQAEGADGIKYNKAGDINIIGYKESAISGDSDDTDTVTE